MVTRIFLCNEQTEPEIRDFIREAIAEGENTVAIEFVRLNPAHARLIENYVKKFSA